MSTTVCRSWKFLYRILLVRYSMYYWRLGVQPVFANGDKKQLPDYAPPPPPVCFLCGEHFLSLLHFVTRKSPPPIPSVKSASALPTLSCEFSLPYTQTDRLTLNREGDIIFWDINPNGKAGLLPPSLSVSTIYCQCASLPDEKIWAAAAAGPAGPVPWTKQL